MRIFLLILAAFSFGSCVHQKTATGKIEQAVQKLAANSLANSVAQYKLLAAALPADKFARTFENGAVKTTASNGWVSGFYPGTLLYLYQFSKDPFLWQEAKARMAVLQKEQFNTHTHDLGFMMFCPFGNANMIAPDTSYRRILINSARSLSARFNPAVGCIRSWDSDSTHFLVIIDNMMNLELLLYAFKQTHDSSFYKIAVTHANTTLANHFRKDYSSFHVVDYDPRTGAVQKKHTHQGANDTSAWARGQSWALYGFTMMYRETGHKKYLEQATHIADFILQHPRLPADKIPFWDFDAPGIPGALRDASAAAVISAALLELSGMVPPQEATGYKSAAVTIIKNLSNPPYRAVAGEAGGFLLQHSVGHMPNKSEIDVPLSYADYYYTEAMLRLLGNLRPGDQLK
jgi:unsaturated chondroitin disaccharide hydrolase